MLGSGFGWQRIKPVGQMIREKTQMIASHTREDSPGLLSVAESRGKAMKHIVISIAEGGGAQGLQISDFPSHINLN